MIDEVLTFYLFDFIQQSLTLLTIVVIISIFNPFSVPVLVLVLIYEYWFISKMMPENIKGIKYELMTKSPLYSLILSAAEGVATISSLNGKQKFTNDLYAAIERNLRAYNHQVTYIYYLSLYADFGTCVYAISNAFFILMLSFYFTDLAAGIALSMIILGATNFSWFLKVWSFTAISLENAQRLIDYSNLPKEGEDHQEKDLEIQTGRIDLLDVSLKYPISNNYALSHLTYTVEPGTKVGIIGRTGAGKSSIFAVLLRLTELSEGTILIDRQDISKHSIRSLRQGISCIPQNSLLFPTSLRNNLDPLNKCHDDQILSALKDVQLLKYFEDIFESRKDRLKELLQSEKDSYKKKRIKAKLKQSLLDMKATSKDISLSVGQLQILSLVRVIIRDNRILLMDEATSSLDAGTDMFVQQMIRTKFKSCTIITIAHRLETIQDYDLILVVDAGKVSEYDTPTNLLQNPQSQYSKLLQASKRA
jgi:ABC-type multidrug transport system fused ATPase/permease subunit